MPLSTQTKDQVLALLKKVETCSLQADFAGSERIIAPDVVMFAPGIEQRGREQFAPGRLLFEEPEVKGEGVIAWVSGGCSLGGKPGRFSAVLRGTGHAWELVLLHIA